LPAAVPELSYDPLDLASVGWNVVEATPVVRLKRQVSEGDETNDGASAVTDNHIEDPMVPPTL
jgi:hypothetical protein